MSMEFPGSIYLHSYRVLWTEPFSRWLSDRAFWAQFASALLMWMAAGRSKGWKCKSYTTTTLTMIQQLKQFVPLNVPRWLPLNNTELCGRSASWWGTLNSQRCLQHCTWSDWTCILHRMAGHRHGPNHIRCLNRIVNSASRWLQLEQSTKKQAHLRTHIHRHYLVSLCTRLELDWPRLRILHLRHLKEEVMYWARVTQTQLTIERGIF